MEAPASQGASRAPYAQDRLLFHWDFLQAELLAKAPTVKKIEEKYHWLSGKNSRHTDPSSNIQGLSNSYCTIIDIILI